MIVWRQSAIAANDLLTKGFESRCTPKNDRCQKIRCSNDSYRLRPPVTGPGRVPVPTTVSCRDFNFDVVLVVGFEAVNLMTSNAAWCPFPTMIFSKCSPVNRHWTFHSTFVERRSFSLLALHEAAARLAAANPHC